MDDITAPPRMPTGASSRVQSFGTGLAGQPDDTATSAGQDPGLNLNQQQFRNATPDHVIQTSVLQPVNPVSDDGMAEQDFERMLPGLSRPLPSPMGSDEDTYQKSIMMRLQGREI